MFQINIITKTKGWFWKKEKYNVYQVVRVISDFSGDTFYFPREYDIISEHMELEDADQHLKQLVKYNIK